MAYPSSVGAVNWQPFLHEGQSSLFRSQEVFYFCEVLEPLIPASHLFSHHIKLFSFLVWKMAKLTWASCYEVCLLVF